MVLMIATDDLTVAHVGLINIIFDYALGTIAVIIIDVNDVYVLL